MAPDATPDENNDTSAAAKPATKTTTAKSGKTATTRSARAKTVAKPASKSTKATATKVKSASETAAPKQAETKQVAPKQPEPQAAAPKPVAPQSRDTAKSGKEHDEHVERVWEMAKQIGIAMFVTWDGTEQRARPLAAKVEKDERAIYFLTDIHGHKDDQVAEFPHVSVNFADHKRSKYVALSGKATVSNDREKIKELWSPFAQAWWDSPEDPAIRVIKVTPKDAELWDSPGRVVTTISMLAAAVTGGKPKVGENAKVVL
jgi:general stress protein 26